MDSETKQRANVKLFGKSATVTHGMLKQACGNEAVIQSRCFEWHSCFKNGKTSLKDDEMPGRPHTCNTGENVEKFDKLCIMILTSILNMNDHSSGQKTNGCSMTTLRQLTELSQHSSFALLIRWSSTSSEDKTQRPSTSNSVKKKKIQGRMTAVMKKLRVQSHEVGEDCNCPIQLQNPLPPHVGITMIPRATMSSRVMTTYHGVQAADSRLCKGRKPEILERNGDDDERGKGPKCI
ncbi:hypothetical protein ANN_17613 [Periplaneta americana]|uniref:Mos1 transposase HTH domain-containing protein n=1 Tax=Periplaneta americana TaxID=6978 RepID=A0ABQ8STF5_PERAM|nr:hypothetical protein ANN_17613 [Periplaneta americana]